MSEKISVIIPAFNEEGSIKGVIEDIKSNLARSKYGYEIIAVDDASTDGTARAARAEGVRTITHSRNRGYGASIKTGMKNSDGEFVAIIDADESYAGKDLLNLTGSLQENDMVVGARTKAGARESVLRKIDKFFLNKLASYLVEAKIPDLNSGLRIFRRDKAVEYLRILPEGYSFTTTLTLAFLNNDFRVEFLPIDYRKRRGRSKIRPIHDTLNFIQLILRTIVYFNPLKVFVPASLVLFTAGIAVLLYSHFFLPQIMDITTIVLILASMQILAIGVVADLINRRWKP